MVRLKPCSSKVSCRDRVCGSTAGRAPALHPENPKINPLRFQLKESGPLGGMKDAASQSRQLLALTHSIASRACALVLFTLIEINFTYQIIVKGNKHLDARQKLFCGVWFSATVREGTGRAESTRRIGSVLGGGGGWRESDAPECAPRIFPRSLTALPFCSLRHRISHAPPLRGASHEAQGGGSHSLFLYGSLPAEKFASAPLAVLRF